jgi:hypothetical protein
LIQKVNPKSWAIIYLKFRDTSSNRFYITKIAKRDSPDSNINDRLCFNIFNGAKPFFINFSFSYLYHVEILYPIRYKMARGNLLTLHISIGLQKLNANAILTWEKQWMGGVERFAKMDAGRLGERECRRGWRRFRKVGHARGMTFDKINKMKKYTFKII